MMDRAGRTAIASMNRLILLFLLLALLPLAAPAHADNGDIQAASRSVVRVAVFAEQDGATRMIGHGSGLVVAPDKIITNAHVVEESLYNDTITFRIVPSQGRESYLATVVKWSPENDLALLQLEKGATLTPASLLSGSVADGSDVFAIGYPANVDVALELDENDTMRPQPPVKTRGTVSAGRSAKAFDTILHTAPIAPGHSGGPMVDSCGRVIGINSFGSQADDGGSEFYFAISMKELTAFLRTQKVTYNSVSGPCRSVAELTRAEEERERIAVAQIEKEQRIAEQQRLDARSRIQREQEMAIIEERDAKMAIAGLLLLFALGGVGASYTLFDKGQRQNGKIAGIISGTLCFAAILVFLSRPGFDEVSARVEAALKDDSSDTDDGADVTGESSGKRTCVIQLDRSKVTASSTADVSFDWKDTGCVNGRTQYGENGDGWTRSFVPNSESRVSVINFNPAKNQYRIERYLLGFDAMQKAREARKQFSAKGCSTTEDGLRKIANMNKAVGDVLPDRPNELLIFKCSDEG